MNILSEIELNERQVKAFNDELNRWKEKKTAQIAEEVKTQLQAEFDVKQREAEEEKENFKKEQEDLVEEIKTKMQKVMVKRFTSALQSMYEELKVEARKDVLGDPRIVALEEIKNVVYPLMDETVTKGYVDELARALQMIESKEDEVDRLKAKLKLKEITASLSPVVAEAVEAFVGEAASEEEVVEKYSRLKSLVNEATYSDMAEAKKKDDDKEEEEEEEEEGEEEREEGEEEEEEGEEEEEEGKKKEKKGKKKEKEEEEEEEEEEEPEMEEEELEIRPSVHYEKSDSDETKQRYVNELNEMLDLAGIK
jgi:multidrug efflux pump subunit AcrA (membrane-fusion protein)